MEPQSSPAPGNPLFHTLTKAPQGFSRRVLGGLVTLALIGGLGTGFILSRSAATQATAGGSLVKPSSSPPLEAGINDTKTFRDCATGQLEKGGIEGEGTHHLIREGGPSQTAYLTSSVVDLDQFVGRMVQVCGQTIASQHAGWLMDVGIIKQVQ